MSENLGGGIFLTHTVCLCVRRLYTALVSAAKVMRCIHCSLVEFVLWLDVVTILTADGLKFTHPLHHISKTVDDLPLLVIDSFKHMYLWRHNPKTDLESVPTSDVCVLNDVCEILSNNSS